MLAHSNDLVRDMHALTEEEELVYCDDAHCDAVSGSKSRSSYWKTGRYVNSIVNDINLVA
jgi:hypothetical protein